jgi:hypothetical protein
LSGQAEIETNSLILGCIIKGIIARKEIQKLRQEEMEFLGMSRRP